MSSQLREYTYWFGGSKPCSRDVHPPICDSAANAIIDLVERVDVTAEETLGKVSDNIDNMARHGCAWCRQYEDLPEHVIDGTPIGRIFDTSIGEDANGFHLELPHNPDTGISFCPICGAPLTQEALISIKKRLTSMANYIKRTS